MRVSEFVSIVLKELETLPKPLSEAEMKNLYTLFDQRKNIDPTLMDRSNYPTELVELLNQHKDSKLEATFENLTPFIDCLSDRFKKIKDDERAYNITPNSVANRAYTILAKKLAETLNKNTYETLMPKMVTEELVEASRHYSKK